MTAVTQRALAVWWRDLDKWDFLSTWLRKKFSVSHPLVPLSDLATIRKTVTSPDGLTTERVSMVDKVSFDGEVFAGGKDSTKMEQYLALPGDLIVSKIRARQGSVGLVDGALRAVSVTIHYRVLVPDRSRVIGRYLWLALRSPFGRVQFLAATGGAMKGEISEEALLAINIPLPPLAVQQAIITQWERAQKEIAEAQRRVERFRTDIDAYFFRDLGLTPLKDVARAKCFGVWWKDFRRWSVSYSQAARAGADLSQGEYPIVELGSVLELVQYGTSEKANSKGEGVPILRMNNIVDGVLDTKDLKYIDLPEKERARLLLRDGDILFNRTNSKELVGKCAVFHEEGEYVFASYLIRLRAATAKVLPDFLTFAVNSPIGRTQIDALSRQIIGQANINTDELRSLQIPLPPLMAQHAIMQRVEEGRAAIAREREKARRLATAVEREIEEMILGARPMPETNGLQQVSA